LDHAVLRTVIHDCCTALELECPWPKELDGHLDLMLFAAQLNRFRFQNILNRPMYPDVSSEHRLLKDVSDVLSRIFQGEFGAGAGLSRFNGVGSGKAGREGIRDDLVWPTVWTAVWLGPRPSRKRRASGCLAPLDPFQLSTNGFLALNSVGNKIMPSIGRATRGKTNTISA